MVNGAGSLGLVGGTRFKDVVVKAELIRIEEIPYINRELSKSFIAWAFLGRKIVDISQASTVLSIGLLSLSISELLMMSTGRRSVPRTMMFPMHSQNRPVKPLYTCPAHPRHFLNYMLLSHADGVFLNRLQGLQLRNR
jgi:hypothetical protein